jgi:NAD-dependent deacetylase
MKKLVVFSGAGMSAESGVSTFRDADGLWNRHSIEDVATPDAWQKNPQLVQTFYNERRKQILEVQPNDGHNLIAALNTTFDISIITQNIDNLHEKAGSEGVLHLHGEIMKSKSSGPNAEKEYYSIAGWELKMSSKCPEGYPLRPHVVWFGEEVPMLEEAARIIATCDILIVIGTSLQVYPAAGLIHVAPATAEKVIIDPNADQMQVPIGFEIIAKNAGDGLKIWLQKKGL